MAGGRPDTKYISGGIKKDDFGGNPPMLLWKGCLAPLTDVS